MVGLWRKRVRAGRVANMRRSERIRHRIKDNMKERL